VKKMMTDGKKKLLVDKTVKGHWKVILDNPPINLIDDSMYDDRLRPCDRDRG